MHCRLTKAEAWKEEKKPGFVTKAPSHEAMDVAAMDHFKLSIANALKSDAKNMKLVGQKHKDFVSREGGTYARALESSFELFFRQKTCCALYGVPLRWSCGWDEFSLDRGDNTQLHFHEDGRIQSHCRYVCRLFNVSGSNKFRPEESMLRILASVPSDFKPEIFTDATRETARNALEELWAAHPERRRVDKKS